MFTPDQVIAAQKSNLETLFGLSQKAFEGVEKIVALNLQATKAALDEAAEMALGAKDPKQIFAAQADLLQPAADKAAEYGRQLFDITTEINAEVGKVAEDTASQARKQIMAVVETAAKNAPAGSEQAISLVKASLIAANEAFDGAQKFAKRSAEAVEANVIALTPKTAKAVKTGSAKGKRAA